MSFTEQLFHLEYGRTILQSASDVLNEIGVTLQIPSWEHLLTASHAAVEDSARAFQSSSYFLFLVGQPVLRLLAWILYWMAWFVYKYILVEGIYNHGLSQAKEAAIIYWNWQSSLTKKQLCIEAAAIVFIFAIYRLHKFLERRKYHRRLMIWSDNKKRQVQKVSPAFAGRDRWGVCAKPLGIVLWALWTVTYISRLNHGLAQKNLYDDKRITPMTCLGNSVSFQ